MKKNNFSRNNNSAFSDPGEPKFIDKVVHVNRCAKVVQGGRRFSFSALVVSGDGAGSVGFGRGAALEVAEAVRKATESAHRSLQKIPLKGTTILYSVLGKSDGASILLKPASPGTGVIAAGGVRAVLEAAGIKDILTKSLRSSNSISTVRATLKALSQLKTPELIAALRGKSVRV